MLYGIGDTAGPSVETTAEALSAFAVTVRDMTLLMASLVTRLASTRAKIMLASHLYDDARAFDVLGARITALRGSPNPEDSRCGLSLRQGVAEASRAASPAAALALLYTGAKPALLRAARRHLALVNQIWDRQTHSALCELASVIDRHVTSAESVLEDARAAESVLSSTGRESLREPASDDAELVLETGSAPAREACFTIVPEAPFADIGTPEGTAISLHTTLMSIEIVTLEVCSRLIVDFHSRMPWAFVVDMARQCWDEAHHAMMCWDRIQQLGFRIGQFPIDVQLWDVSKGLPLEVRLGAHQRLGEWLGTDGAHLNARRAHEVDDEVTGRIWEYIESDEVAHVGYGNKWVRFVCGTDEAVRANHLQAAAARARFGKTVFGPASLPFNRHTCVRAGFTDREVEELAQARGR